MVTTDTTAALAWAQQQIRAAAEAAGRDPAAVRLVAVSKTVDTARVCTAYEAGQRDFGENQIPELVRKAQCLPADGIWHMIGHLQRNKVRPAVQAAAWIHSVDSVELLARLDHIAAEERRCPNVLLQINLSGETSKSGVAGEAAASLLHLALRCPHLRCRGLMTMAPYGAPEAELERLFGGLRRLRDRLQDDCGTALPELSMGMSADFRIAIREGATLVRLGTAIFGGRA